MIGMNQIKKRLINGILIGLGIGLVIVIVILIITNNIVKGYEEGTSERFNEQYMTTVQTFNRDIIQGEKITESMVQNASIPKTTMPTNIASAVVGKIAKYNVPKNVAITSGMVSDYTVGFDERIQEINAIVMPEDLAIGEYIDVRIMMPNGVDYIVLAQKRVNDIVNTTIKLDLSEEEILRLNGAIVDAYFTKGTKLYAVKYSDPTTQIKIDEKSMNEAKTYITNKMIDDLVAKGAITKTANTTKTDESTDSSNNIDENTASTIDNLVDSTLKPSGTTSTENTETTKTETLVAATGEEAIIPQNNYSISVGTLDAKELIEMATKYAVEYRYYLDSLNKIDITYQPNPVIIAYMKNNKLITDKAKEKLSAEVRSGMDMTVKYFELISTEEEYEEFITKIEEGIAAQKALRGEVLQNNAVTPNANTTNQ